MSDTRTVVLGLSPSAAWLLREATKGIAEGLRSQAWDDDSESPITPADLPTLDALTVEITSQLDGLAPAATPATPVAQGVAEQMAAAGAAAISKGAA
jgi:hypothetical protein